MLQQKLLLQLRMLLKKDGPKDIVEKVVETYAEKVKVSAAGVKTAEVSRAGVSASTTSASNTTRTTFQRAAEAFVQTKTDLEQTKSRQHEVALVEVTADRTISADQTDIQRVDSTFQVVVKTANKSVNAHQVFADFSSEK